MLMPVKHIELPEVLSFRIWFHNPLFPLAKQTVGADRPHARSIVGAAPFPHAAGVPPDQDEVIITEQLGFFSLLFGNPVTFLAILAEVIRQTML